MNNEDFMGLLQLTLHKKTKNDVELRVYFNPHDLGPLVEFLDDNKQRHTLVYQKTGGEPLAIEEPIEEIVDFLREIYS